MLFCEFIILNAIDIISDNDINCDASMVMRNKLDRR